MVPDHNIPKKICFPNGLALLSHRTQNTRDKTQALEEQNVHEGWSKNQCYQEEENECLESAKQVDDCMGAD